MPTPDGLRRAGGVLIDISLPALLLLRGADLRVSTDSWWMIYLVAGLFSLVVCVRAIREGSPTLLQLPRPKALLFHPMFFALMLLFIPIAIFGASTPIVMAGYLVALAICIIGNILMFAGALRQAS